MKYKAGYKYQLAETVVFKVVISSGQHQISTPFIRLGIYGDMQILKGYAWDGPSGPAIDTKNFMRGSLVHDALYQLMRQGHLGDEWRDKVDRLLQKMCIEDGMWRIRAWWVYKSLKWFGGSAADPENKKPVLIAP